MSIGRAVVMAGLFFVAGVCLTAATVTPEVERARIIKEEVERIRAEVARVRELCTGKIRL